MTTLIDIDENHPDGDTETVSVLDDYEKETRLAVKTTVAIEHALTGEHKFLSGNTAARPAAGHAGRIYFNTQTQTIERDNGTSWEVAASANAQGSLGVGFYTGVGGSQTVSTGFPFIARLVLVWGVNIAVSAFLRSQSMSSNTSLKLSDGTLVTTGITDIANGTFGVVSEANQLGSLYGFLVIA